MSGTVTLGGSGLAGVAFTASGGTCTNSNASGQYSCAVPPGWSGSVTPSLSGYAFTPASRNYTNVTTNQTAQNYTATPTFQVSGTVSLSGSGLSGVAFTANNGGSCTTSNASGQYSCTVTSGWSGTVTPSLGSYSFSPTSRNYTNVTAHQSAQDYATVTVQVSGTASVGALPLGGIAFAATNNGACTTSNTSGQYSCTVPQGWSGSVTASLAGYNFAPASRNYSNVTADQSAQDYAAAAVAGVAAIYYLHTDHLDSPRVITNQPAQAVWRWDQVDPFGANAANENPSGLGTFTCNLRLPGQYFDKETNLHYNYFRDFDPAIGRYIQSDSIGLKGGINTYAYVSDNPLSFADPTGQFRYKPDPNIVPLSPDMEENVRCLEKCLKNIELVITGAAEKSGHLCRTSQHYSGQAVDFGLNSNPKLRTRGPELLCCAAGCNFTNGWVERYKNPDNDHYHIQIVPGCEVPPLPKCPTC